MKNEPVKKAKERNKSKTCKIKRGINKRNS
jgi:hypothetical protein